MKNESYKIPRSWLEATQPERDEWTNGCGAGWKKELFAPKRAWKRFLNWAIPDTMWFLSVKDICNWHDWEYEFLPKTRANKKLADDNFLHNLEVHINKHSNFLTRPLRLRRAKDYYFLVSTCGEAAFLNGGKFLG